MTVCLHIPLRPSLYLFLCMCVSLPLFLCISLFNFPFFSLISLSFSHIHTHTHTEREREREREREMQTHTQRERDAERDAQRKRHTSVNSSHPFPWWDPGSLSRTLRAFVCMDMRAYGRVSFYMGHGEGRKHCSCTLFFTVIGGKVVTGSPVRVVFSRSTPCSAHFC